MYPNNKALLVGIDEYKTAPLSCCCNDVDAMDQLLSWQENSNRDRNFFVQKHKNVKTKGELLGLIQECFGDKQDVALFYYSGHGYIDSFGGYLVPSEYSPNDWGVSLQDVLTAANNSPSTDKIVILDSCFSGAMGAVPAINQNTAFINEGVTILTSCSKDQPALAGAKNSVFTSLLLEALNGGAADVLGHITVGGIYAFIDKSLTPWDQRPIFKTNVSRFTSLRDVTPQVPLQIIKEAMTYFADPSKPLKLDPSFEKTNDPDVKHEYKKPYAYPENVAKLKNLQKLVSIGLVVPDGAEHMYFAAMDGKACKLTAVGQHYWKLVKDGKI